MLTSDTYLALKMRKHVIGNCTDWCWCFNSLNTLCFCTVGDAAIGIGVTRHILSTTIAELKHGFKLNCGMIYC